MKLLPLFFSAFDNEVMWTKKMLFNNFIYDYFLLETGWTVDTTRERLL